MLDRASWYHFLHAVGPLVRHVPWVVLTDAPFCALAIEALRLGARDVLNKPVTAAELLLVLRGSAPAARAMQAANLSLAQVEWEHINNVIRRYDGNISQAARKLGMPRQTLYRRMRKPPATRFE
jgi:two-component system response regulator RegA